VKLKLEDKLVRALGPGDYYDTVVRGLVLRVRDKARRYVIRYRLPNAEPRRMVLADVGEKTLAEARDEARRQLAHVRLGKDPLAVRQIEAEAEARRRAGDTVKAAIATWLRDSKLGPAGRWKGGLAGGTARAYLPHVRSLERDLGARRLAEVSQKDVERFITAPAVAATRNRRLTAFRMFVAWARRKGLLDSDPSGVLGKEREQERSRTLTDDELRALIRGFDGTRYGRAVRLLALTGLRRDEVLGARWSWIDSGAGILTIPPEAEKTGRARGEPRRVALSPQVGALLAEQREALFAEGIRSDFVFATATGGRPHADALKPFLYRLRGRRPNGRAASTDKRAKPRTAVLAADVRLHDVRRSVADALLNRLQVAPWIVDHVVLGHVRPKLLRTYMPTLPLAEAREALAKWGALLESIIAGESGAAKA